MGEDSRARDGKLVRDVTRDGQTFVFVTGASSRAWKQVNVVLDWSSALSRLAPAGKK